MQHTEDPNIPRESLNLVQLRQAKKMSQAELARATGIEVGFLCRMERGKVPIGAKAALTLSNFFEVPISLLYRQAPPSRRPGKRPRGSA